MNTFLLHCGANAAHMMRGGHGPIHMPGAAEMGVVRAVCGAVVMVTVILVVGFLLWKLMEQFFKGCQERRRRQWELEDRDRKQKADLKDKKLAFLKELCYVPDEKGKSTLKRDGDECKEYLAALDGLMDCKTKQEKE